MVDPRRREIRAGALSLAPAEAPERWGVTNPAAMSTLPEASWGDWVQLARRILEVDALSRDLEGRGDAWDQGYAAGATGEPDALNPFR